VQTLSRLNRTHPLKEDTFVLDFLDQREEVQEAFKQFYDGAEMGEEVEPARLYEVKAELDASNIYMQQEVDGFCNVFFKPKERQSPSDHRAMNAALDPAVDRFKALLAKEEEEGEDWRGKMQAFRNLYAFLSQVIPYQDSDLEKLYTYFRFLAVKLPRRSTGPNYQFDETVRLEYYRLQKISEGSINLNEGEAKPLDGPKEVGSGMARKEEVPLSRLIDVINERFGTDFNEADQFFFEQMIETAYKSESLKQAAQVNPLGKFQLVFRELLQALFIERMDMNEGIVARYMNEADFRETVADIMGKKVYDRLTKPSTTLG
jgi:type I restriction enzyme, R subunit